MVFGPWQDVLYLMDVREPPVLGEGKTMLFCYIKSGVPFSGN